MSDLSNDNFSVTKGCDCYKKLQTYGIPLYISDENDLYIEDQKITFENAFPLPGRLEIDEKITEYLTVEDNDLYSVFYHMAIVIPKLRDFEVNVLNFWLLDMFIEGLWTAQNANMHFKHQKATLLWIAYCFNYIQKENPTRSSFFDHLKGVIFQVGCYRVEDTGSETNEKIGESIRISASQSQILEIQLETEKKHFWDIPLPPDYIDKEQDSTQTLSSEEENLTASDVEDTTDVLQVSEVDELNESIKNREDMTVIFEIIYRIFGRLWVYLEIQTVFHNMPATNQVDLPFHLPTPKPLLKIDSFFELKPEKAGRRQTTSEISEIELDAELHKNNFILPLQVAEESPSILKRYYSGNNSQLFINKQKKSLN